MRCVYREKYFKCGDYLDVSIYPAYRKSEARRRKGKPTKEGQKKLNEIYAENKLIRLCNANFTHADFKAELTYRDNKLPKTDEEAAKELYNFFRRMKTFRKRKGLPDLKYIAVTEKGSRTGRYHHHIIISGGVSPQDIVRIWGNGIVHTDCLQFDENGIADLARYMIKRSVASGKRWNASKNLYHPEPRQRDGRLAKRDVRELAKDTDNRREYEKYFKGYYLAEARKIYNDVNGGIYIYARFYKKGAYFCSTNTNRQKK